MGSIINPVFLANRGGIPRIESTGVNVTTTGVNWEFKTDIRLSRMFSGLVIVRLAQAVPEGTTATLPVSFVSAGSTQPLTGFGGAAITAGDIPGTGIYLAYYEGSTGVLQLMASLV